MKPFLLSSRAGWLKLLLGTALVLVLLLLVDLRRLWSSLAGADGLLLAASLLVACAAVVLLEARRFQSAFAGWGLSYGAALRVTLASLFVGSFTPGAVGVEIYRLYAIRRRERGMVRPLVRLAILRVIGAVAVVLVAVGAWLATPERFGGVVERLEWRWPSLSRPVLLALILGGIVLIILASAILLAGWRRLASRARQATRQGWEELAGIPLRELGELLGLSLGIAVLRGLSLELLVRSLGVGARFGDLLVVVALSVMASMLPISPAGLGIQEGVLAGCLVLCRVPAPAAVAAALLNRAFLWLFAAAGGWVLAVWPAPPPTADGPRPGSA
jgi:uncharacterized membrane protein YbhN (UPF0104 family)